MAPQRPVPPPPPLSTYRPSTERPPLGSGPRRGPATPGGGRPRPPTRQRPSSGLLLGLVYFFLAVVFVAGAGATYLLLNPPSDLIRQKIAEQVKLNTGRDLVIAGPASFTIFPVLGVSLNDVSLSGPPGAEAQLVKMRALNVSVKALSLLSRQIEINSLILKSPVFDFRVDKAGRANWKFATRAFPAKLAELRMPGSRRDLEAVDVANLEARPSSGNSGTIADLRLDDVQLEDGTLRFSDERTGKSEQVSGVNVRVALRSLAHPLVAKGSFAWRDHRVDFDGQLADVASILNEKPSRLAFNAKNDLLEASYDGSVLISDGAYLEGRVTAQSASARSLANWFGTALPPVSGFGPLSIRGTLKTRGNVTSFSDAEFGLDGASARGTVTVTTGGVRPYVEASLAAAELDLNKYLTSAVTGLLATEGGASAGSPQAGTQSGAGGDARTEPDEIEKLLDRQGSKVYGAVQRAGWSSEKLNLTLLGVADGSARVNVGKLHFKDVTVGQSVVNVAVKDRAMTATFEDVQLYQGRGKGTVSVDGATGRANIGANLDFENVSALPFLKDAAHFEWIAGNANVGLRLTANGASQLQLIESLNGKAEFHFANGAIVGFNLPGAIRGLSNGDFSALKTSPSEKTDFSALSATFAITNGVAENKDLQLVSPLLRVTGAGVVHMPERTVDYTVKPKLVASLEGQDGDGAASGIEIPVRITGSWDRPTYRPDLKGVLSNPDKTVETIKEIGKKFKGKNAGQIVDELFGKKEGEAKGGSTPGSKQSAKELLNKLLGKQETQN